MSAKTKILVLHRKELIFTGILAVLGVILIILLLIMFLPKTGSGVNTKESAKYIPGVYTSTVNLNDTALDVQVTVDQNQIQSVSVVNLNEAIETMYPLVEPAIKELEQQIIQMQSLEKVTCSEKHPYTSMLLLSAVDEALKKASPE